MMMLLQMARTVGVRGLIGAVVGGVLVGGAAYPLGHSVGAAVGTARSEQAAAVQLQKHLEAQHAQIRAALEARLRAYGRLDDRADGSGLPDDGWRRD